MEINVAKTIKAIFLDIDGTYFDHVNNQVRNTSKLAVNQLREKGYKVALCSGRPLEMAKQLPLFDDMAWDGFIGSAGAMVYDEHFQLLAKNGLSTQQLNKLFAIGEQLDLTMYAIGSTSFLTRHDPHAEAVLSSFHVRLPKAIRPYQSEDAIEIISLFEGYDYDYSPFLEVEGVCLQKSSGVIMDLVQNGIHKAMGIQQLMKTWGLQNAGYLAFGDSMNDKEMLQEAAYGVAMGNGTKDLFPYANHICGRSDEDSIYQTLQQIGLL